MSKKEYLRSLDYRKIISCINSCNTKRQLKTCTRLIKLYESKQGLTSRTLNETHILELLITDKERELRK